VTPESLIATAAALARPFTPSGDCTSGTVAAALVTTSGKTYTGVCIDTRCGLGFCAEHAAVARMLEAREANVAMIVAVTADGRIIPPCGRCRELLWQISPANQTTWVVLGTDSGCPLSELLPHR
jgi:cytidine deaminase